MSDTNTKTADLKLDFSKHDEFRSVTFIHKNLTHMIERPVEFAISQSGSLRIKDEKNFSYWVQNDFEALEVKMLNQSRNPKIDLFKKLSGTPEQEFLKPINIETEQYREYLMKSGQKILIENPSSYTVMKDGSHVVICEQHIYWVKPDFCVIKWLPKPNSPSFVA